MDIALLSKMIGEMVPYHDIIGLPGLGSFVVEDMPAAFADRGYTLNPPYKSLSFIPECPDDSAVVGYYAECNRISPECSRAILTDYLSQLKDLLVRKKAVSFPGLGLLRSTADNRFFFVPDENPVIYPDGLPLEPISLKNHVETEEVAIDVRNLSSLLFPKPSPEPYSEPSPEPEAADVPAADVTPEPAVEPEEPHSGNTHTLLYVILSIVVLLVVALSTFLILVEVNPDFIDSILYTPEELEIINW